MPWPKEFSLQELLAVSWNACRSTPKTPPSWVGPVEISLPLRGLLPSLSSGLVEWDLIPDGFLGHPSFMMFYWFVRDSKIFQVSGNWISGSRCWSLVDILQSSLLVIHNHSWENLFEWQPRCFFPCKGRMSFSGTAARRASEILRWNFLFPRSFSTISWSPRASFRLRWWTKCRLVPWWQPWFTLWSTSKNYRILDESREEFIHSLTIV